MTTDRYGHLVGMAFRPKLGDHWVFENVPDRPGIQPGLGGRYTETSREFYRTAEVARAAGWTVQHVKRDTVRLVPPGQSTAVLNALATGQDVWLAFRMPRTLTLRQCPGPGLDGAPSCRGCTAEYLRTNGGRKP